MTLPEWTEPTPPAERPPLVDRHGQDGDEPPEALDPPPLAGKPVLEWTDEDWARWVTGGIPGTASPAAEPAAAEPVGAKPAVVEPIAVDPEAIADLVAVEPDAVEAPEDEGEGERPWEEGPDHPIVDIRLPEETSLLSALPDELYERPWDEPPEIAVAAARLEEPAVDVGERPWDEPPDVLSPPQLEPPPAVEHLALDHDDLRPRQETSAVRQAPVRYQRGATEADGFERSRRIRSAFELLAVAVAVGVLIALLITVTVIAISMGVRRAVG